MAVDLAKESKVVSRLIARRSASGEGSNAAAFARIRSVFATLSPSAPRGAGTTGENLNLPTWSLSFIAALRESESVPLTGFDDPARDPR